MLNGVTRDLAQYWQPQIPEDPWMLWLVVANVILTTTSVWSLIWCWRRGEYGVVTFNAAILAAALFVDLLTVTI